MVVCVDMCPCDGLVKSPRSTQLSPHDRWDRLQLPCDSEGGFSGGRWKNESGLYFKKSITIPFLKQCLWLFFFRKANEQHVCVVKSAVIDSSLRQTAP